MNLIGFEVFPSGPFTLFIDPSNDYPLEILRPGKDTALVQYFQNLPDFLPLPRLIPPSG